MRIIVRFISIAAALAALSGCAVTNQMKGKMNNALAPTLACDMTFYVSEYFNTFGITSRVRQADHDVIRAKWCPKDAPAAVAAPVAAPAALPASAKQ